MAFKGIYWKGRPIVIPGAYAYVNADAMVPDRLSPANTIGAVGICRGGKPGTALRVTSLREALNTLRGGDLARAAELMYDPSSEIPGAGEVVFVRVNKATQASYTGSGFTVTSKDYGEHTNFIRFKIEDGTVEGKKITIQHQSDDINEVLDNVGSVFTIKYTGSVAQARLNINRTTGVLKVETSQDGNTWNTLVEYNLSAPEVSQVGLLIDALDGHPDLVCTASKYLVSYALPSTELDGVTAQDIKTSEYTATAVRGSVKYWADVFSSLITFTPTTYTALTNMNWTNLSGGGEGSAPTLTDWADAIDVLSQEADVKFVYVASGNEAVHLLALQHCEQMSDIKEGKERILICGGSLGETVDAVTTRAINMGAKRSVLVYPGIKRYNLTTGNLDTLAPYLAAAIVVGMAGGTPPELPLTFKTIKVQGLEKYLTNTELETLLNKGVCPLRFVKEDGIYQIVQSITTWQKDANVIYRKLSGMRIHDYLRQEVRNTAKRYIGQVADQMTIVSLRNAIAAKLDLLTRTPQNLQGVLTPATDESGKPTPSWKNLVVTYDGFDWVMISFDAHPVGEIAYITIEAVLKPAKMVIT